MTNLVNETQNLLPAGEIKKVKKPIHSNTMGPAPVSPVVPGPVSPFQTCFIAGSLVYMADGTFKKIEEVEANDKVVGAFGEINTVIALDRTTLGDRPIYKINNEHCTTAEHPHVSSDKKFYSINTKSTYLEYGTVHNCLATNDKIEKLVFHGVRPGRVQELKLGMSLQKIQSSKTVESIEELKMPASTLLFNLVVSGSHTYFVNDYAVSGWIRDDDFDYDSWTKIEVPAADLESYNHSRYDFSLA